MKKKTHYIANVLIKEGTEKQVFCMSLEAYCNESLTRELFDKQAEDIPTFPVAFNRKCDWKWFCEAYKRFNPEA